MSIRGNADGTATPLVPDMVVTPDPLPYEENKNAADKIKVYATHHGVKRHVPLCESSKTELHHAVIDANPAKLAELLEDPSIRAKIDKGDWLGFTPLHMTCQTVTTGPLRGTSSPPTIECAKLLIDAGADINAHVIDDQWGYTPLHFAVSSLYPQVEICGFLLEKGVDLCAVDAFGNTPLHNAAIGTHTAQLRVLTAHPDWDKAIAIKNKEGQTALQIADDVVARQTKKVELAPMHDETRMLLATRRGFEQIKEREEKQAAKKKGKA